MRPLLLLSLFFLLNVGISQPSSISQTQLAEISAEELRDKIRGGLLGQILGNLNGIPHEMQYIHEPGSVSDYVPSLPDGARTDDDTDFEWVYILEMQRRNTLFLSSKEIAQLWRERINRRIWCSNQYARQLMDLDIVPPLTGNVLLNPWAEFNISGQFLCETFGLLGPGMPQTASKIGLNYTRVAIDGEPAQTTQLFNTMIATAFFEGEVEKILDAGVRALDPQSSLVALIAQVREWHAQNPRDWKKTRLLIKETYSQVNGAMRDRNGYELNTAATIAALLYGEGDFALTLQHAFNYGWDCDNVAASAGTILGVVQGYRWMMAQGWQIVDRYKNTTRDNMPMDETITSFADRLIELAEKVILKQGGEKFQKGSGTLFKIPIEEASNVAPFLQDSSLRDKMLAEHQDEIQRLVMGEDSQSRARGAYWAICLNLASEYQAHYPRLWEKAILDLQSYEQVVQALFHHSPVPAAEPLRAKALQAGIVAPRVKKRLWENK